MSKWFNTKQGLWNVPANPFGNYREPDPVPLHNVVAAASSKLPAWLWWWKRNPASNFCDFWVGLLTLNDDGTWTSAGKNGWFYLQASARWGYWFKPGKRARPYYRRDGKKWTFYIGWRASGAFGIAFRSNRND